MIIVVAKILTLGLLCFLWGWAWTTCADIDEAEMAAAQEGGNAAKEA